MIRTTCAVNRVVLVGIIGQRGVEVVYREAGKAMASFLLTCDEPGPGERLFSTHIPVETFGKGAEDVGELAAGQCVLVEGKLRWKPGDGGKTGQLLVTAWAWDVRVMDGRPAREGTHA